MQSFYKLFAFLLAVVFIAGCDSASIPSDVGSNTALGFEENSVTVSEDAGSVTLNIVVNDAGFKELAVDIVRTDGDLSDDEYSLPSTVEIPRTITSGESFPVTIDLVDDDVYVEGDETAIFTLQNPQDASVGDMGTFTLTVEENDIPTANADAKATAEDSGGGEDVVVDGIVTRVESDGFYLQDDSGALFVFDGDVIDSVTRGDYVVVRGTTAFFSGLFQLNDLDEDQPVRVISSGNALPAVQTVTTADLADNGEQYESELVEVRFLEFADGSGSFASGSENYDVSDLTGVVIPLRVPSGSFYAGASRPAQATYTGVVGQFNGFGEPTENTGYQLLGLTDGDIQEASFTVQALVDEDFSAGTIAGSSFSAFSVASSADWETANFSGSNFYAEANAFGSDEPANDWLISPAFDLSSVEGDVLTFENTSNFSDDIRGLKVLVSTDYDGTSNPEDFTWTDLSDQATFSDGGFSTVNSGPIDLSGPAFQSSNVYVAFQYESTGTGPNEVKTWQVDNILVNGVE